MKELRGLAQCAKIKGTPDGGFQFHVEIGDRVFIWPENDPLTFELALGMIGEVAEVFELRPDQILLNVGDAFYCPDRSETLEGFRAKVRQNPELVATLEKYRKGE